MTAKPHFYVFSTDEVLTHQQLEYLSTDRPVLFCNERNLTQTHKNNKERDKQEKEEKQDSHKKGQKIDERPPSAVSPGAGFISGVSILVKRGFNADLH